MDLDEALRKLRTEFLRCGDCAFWMTDEEGGTCHRYAPRPSGDSQIVRWPRTREDSGCGDGVFGRGLDVG